MPWCGPVRREREVLLVAAVGAVIVDIVNIMFIIFIRAVIIGIVNIMLIISYSYEV